MNPPPADAAAFDSPFWTYRVEQVEKRVDAKADKTEIEALRAELVSIKRLLVAVLLAIIAGCIGFGFAAIQIAANVHGA